MGKRKRKRKRKKQRAQSTGSAEPVSTAAEPKTAVTRRCGYCAAEVAPNEGVVCTACLVVQHEVCWDKHGATRAQTGPLSALSGVSVSRCRRLSLTRF